MAELEEAETLVYTNTLYITIILCFWLPFLHVLVYSEPVSLCNKQRCVFSEG